MTIKYYKILDGSTPVKVFRTIENEVMAKGERYDRDRAEWVNDPDVYSELLGFGDIYEDSNEKEVETIIADWSKNK